MVETEQELRAHNTTEAEMAMEMWTVPHQVHVMVHAGAVGYADDAMLRYTVELSRVSLHLQSSTTLYMNAIQ